MSKIIGVDCSRISDWPSFHEEFSKAFRFPAFYGRNAAAWVDCMTTPGEMTDVGLRTADVVTINLIHGQGLKDRAPSLLSDLFEMVAFVNMRHVEAREPGRLCLSGTIKQTA
ncbi:MAG TPA: barstar family protein [Allosphingosinicella sp.]|jgi:RNAse (barnase) inhibitor barstar